PADFLLAADLTVLQLACRGRPAALRKRRVVLARPPPACCRPRSAGAGGRRADLAGLLRPHFWSKPSEPGCPAPDDEGRLQARLFPFRAIFELARRQSLLAPLDAVVCFRLRESLFGPPPGRLRPRSAATLLAKRSATSRRGTWA